MQALSKMIGRKASVGGSLSGMKVKVG